MQPGLDGSQLASQLKIKNLKVTDETAETITFADGTYNKVTGDVSYVKKELIPPFDKMAQLHKLPVAQSKPIVLVTTIFGVALFLLAVTSLFMYKPKSKQFKVNMIYTAIGVAETIVLVMLV